MIALPDAVRTRVVAQAADVLGGIAPAEVPASLRPVAKFAAAKRARLGGNAIAAALESDPGFRRRVLDAAADADPALFRAVEAGEPPAAADPVDVAVMAYLLRPEGWESLVESATESVRDGVEEERRVREAAAVERVREQLEAARASARETRATMKAEVDRLKSENTTLRRRLQETRQRLEQASNERDEHADASRRLADAQAAQRSAEAEVRKLRARVGELETALENARRDTRAERSLGTARLALLIDTLNEAAGGLRRELALPPSSLRPADTVDAVEPAREEPGTPTRARATDEPAYLDELLSLPRAHMIVDGYNVTKTAWPTMPLDAQRTRLVQGLAALSARTSAEVTCVFDGADVAVPPPVAAAQRVRVRFSPEGHSADELIRSMVDAEPEGRAVVVVSSDREVAEGVRRPGVRPVDAAALAGLLAR
ncbi:YacP-like NYN domain-containing protein [Haloactinopolyspora alba]|uniref:YacP-like NYN domain-containing protein n=1 Tax=Haloactinopolyspora alba TaxID=648780 RepID=A0A2P8DR68_9ACTN|nr:NYN domain-containing protein [Haloactinopolyspora alba]PSK99707.1 YacP-like NYN domain-containing protein [Haloactinopolyspora alba]